MVTGPAMAKRINGEYLGILGAVAKSTLADANETRDWRIHAEVAQ